MAVSEQDRQAILRSAGALVTVDGRAVYGIIRDRFEVVGSAGNEVAAQELTLRVSESVKVRQGSLIVDGAKRYEVDSGRGRRDAAGFMIYRLLNLQ